MEDEFTSTSDKSDKSLSSRLKRCLQAQKTHWLILFLVTIDFLCFMTMIVLSFLWANIEREQHWIFETLTIIAFIINVIFLIEITLSFIVFGLSYFTKGPHWFFHIFDALLVFTTFFLEIFLHGKQQEIVGLFIILRFWRLIKVVGSVAIGIAKEDNWNDERMEKVFQGKDVKLVTRSS
ncbi:6867_t:CDS:2 [Scutellospora calospora]|uniref:6867_t:CDS:1 n=1 Tax=Scutellospora calospora TaxID=85575 RepID=A0ACA9M1B1_9GLOM|nr:6867_t:CDS:2 [Scutellospora calospora]